MPIELYTWRRHIHDAAYRVTGAQAANQLEDTGSRLDKLSGGHRIPFV